MRDGEKYKTEPFVLQIDVGSNFNSQMFVAGHFLKLEKDDIISTRALNTTERIESILKLLSD